MQQIYGSPWLYSSLLRVDEMVESCWSEDNCVVRQLSAHLNSDPEMLEEELTAINEDWRKDGVTPRDILHLGKRLDRNTFILG